MASEGEYKSTEKSNDHDCLHRAPRRSLKVLAIIDIAADVELYQRSEPPPETDHSAALMVKMNHSRSRKIIAVISSVSDPLTVVGVDVV